MRCVWKPRKDGAPDVTKTTTRSRKSEVEEEIEGDDKPKVSQAKWGRRGGKGSKVGGASVDVTTPSYFHPQALEIMPISRSAEKTTSPSSVAMGGVQSDSVGLPHGQGSHAHGQKTGREDWALSCQWQILTLKGASGLSDCTSHQPFVV